MDSPFEDEEDARIGDRPEISVVVPLLDEQENLGPLYNHLTDVLESISLSYELVLVNDGSRDATGPLLERLAEDDPHVVPIHLSRNFGHQSAISAGIDHARGRAVVLMDGDFQDPPELLPRMVALWREGAEVVYAVRKNRKESLPLRIAYSVFYRLLRSISELEIPLDSGDFCLMDRQVVDVLKHLPERLRFVRGLRTFVGFRQVPIHYDRPARAAGEPKYRFRSLLRLAIDGLVSFSGYPLQLVTYLGLFAAAVAGGLTAWAFWDALTSDQTPRGWASQIIVTLFMFSILMLNQGILGAYIHRIYLEVKQRPTYIVRRRRRDLAKLEDEELMGDPAVTSLEARARELHWQEDCEIMARQPLTPTLSRRGREKIAPSRRERVAAERPGEGS